MLLTEEKLADAPVQTLFAFLKDEALRVHVFLLRENGKDYDAMRSKDFKVQTGVWAATG